MVIRNTCPSLSNIVHTDFELGRLIQTVTAADPGITVLSLQMASAPNQATTAGGNSGEIPESLGQLTQLGPPGTECAVCKKQINVKGACKLRCKFGNLRKADGVPASCICYCLIRSLCPCNNIPRGKCSSCGASARNTRGCTGGASGVAAAATGFSFPSLCRQG